MPVIEALVHDASLLWRLLTADIVTTFAVLLIVAAIVVIFIRPAPRHRSRIDPGYVRWLELKVQIYESALRFYAKPELYVPHTKDELPPIVSERGDMAERALTQSSED
jgi:hypothetical protein